VAVCAFIPFLATFLNGENWGISLLVSMIASFALVAIIPKPGTSEEKPTTRHLRLFDWWLVTYFVIIGLGFNWACVFLSFSRRYAFFSTPVITVTGLIMASYAAIALLVGLLTRGNWRAALLVFVLCQARWLLLS